MISSTDLAIRHFVYQYFIAEARPPTPAETAAVFHLTEAEACTLYQRLHEHHFFFLDPGTSNIRLANPLSAIPTDYKVTIHGKSYWANCAWDMFGIPAMLHQDALLEARFPGEATVGVEIRVNDGEISPTEGVVHFLLPFRQWYDDLIDT